jgi:isopenicillin-N epimerase
MLDPRALFALDSESVYLNHGSFGATPRSVLAVQSHLRERMEHNPMQFLVRAWEPLVDEARAALGRFLGAHPNDLAAVPNATAGVNTALRAAEIREGDELLVTDHEYNACANALDAIARERGATVVLARVPFPLRDASEVVEAIAAKVNARTRLALIDHVTSQTALVLPVARIVSELRARGVETIIDGAHAPGMLPLDLDALGAAYYTGNLHKWVCAPKGAAFLHVRRDLQARTRPLTISHGANSPRTDRSRFRLEFDWTGTADPTAFLAVPAAIEAMGALLPGGWASLRERNRQLALYGRDRLCEALDVDAPAPIAMLGAMAAVPLPPELVMPPSAHEPEMDPLQWALLRAHKIEVPIIPWPDGAHRLVRVSAQIYNRPEEYDLLASALRAMR